MFHPDKVYNIQRRDLSIRDSTTTHPYPVVMKFFGMSFLSHYNYTLSLSDLCLDKRQI